MDIMTLATQQRARAAKGEDVTTLDAAEVAEIKAHTFPNGCHIAEVEVDPETGVVRVVRYSVTRRRGQGGQPADRARPGAWRRRPGLRPGGAGAHRVRPGVRASSLSGSFMDYALPRADDLPDIEVDLIEVPCAGNPLGVKGAGEAGAVGSPPAVINAIVDALASDGVTHIDMPATPEKVWKALAMAEAA